MATVQVTYQPVTGREYVGLTGWTGSALFANTPVATDQIEGPDALTYPADSDPTGPDGNYTLRHIIASTGQTEAVSYQIGTGVAATLSAATATATGETTATGTVDTDTASGDLYVLASINANESAATIIAAGLSQAVSATGTQNVSVSGLTAGETYYLHYVQVTDGNNSNVEPSLAFTTDIAPSSATATVPFTAGSTYTTATLAEGFDPYNFQGWPAGEPAVGWQITTLTADGYFDSMGNYFSDVEHIHDVWITDLAGTVYYQTVDNTSLKVALSGTITIGTATIGKTTASIPFTYSGTDATGYQYRLYDAGAWGAWTTTTSPVDLSGLTASTAYTVEVRAVNLTSESPADSLAFTTQATTDNVPDAFTFVDQTGVALGTEVISAPITVTGIDAGVDVLASVTSDSYSVSTDGGATYGGTTTADTNVRLNYKIRVHHTSSANYSSGNNSGQVSTTLTLAGAVSDTFTSTTIADTTKPVISLVDGNQTITQGDTWTDPGYTATDNADGDLTASVTVTGTVDTSTVGDYPLTYSVTDSSDNTGTATRTVTVVEAVQTDSTDPVITLTGGNQTLTEGDTWVEPGYTATDNVDGDLTASVVVSGALDTTTAGTYTRVYTVTDAADNTGTASRTVTVEPAIQYELTALAPADRTYVGTRARRIEAGERAFVKQPNEILDFDFDLTDWLALQGDTLTSNLSITTAEGSLDIVGQGVIPGTSRVKVWLSGGSDGYTYPVTLLITTTGQRRAEFEFRLLVLDRMAA